MSKKYRKEKVIMIDLSDRKNIQIIKSEKTTIADSDIETLEIQLETRFKEMDEFQKYLIEKEIKENVRISDEEFKSTMKNILKQHKVLKCLLQRENG